MHTIEVTFTIVSGLAVATGLFTHWIRAYWINEPLVALLLGILVSPELLGWIDLDKHSDPIVILEFVALVTLALTLVSVGVELRGSL